MDWPHYYLFKNNKPPTFADLTLPDFIYGYLCMLDNATDLDRPRMSSLLNDLMEDMGNGYQWMLW